MPNPRSVACSPWRTALKALSGGLWLMATSLVAVATVLMGTGWLLAISTSARSAVQPLAVLSIPPGGLDFTAVSKNVAGETSAGSSAFVERFVFGVPVAEPMGRFAMATPASFAAHDDLPFYTGSIAPPAALLAAGEDGTSVPLPRTRPRLTALGPIGNLGIKVPEEARPPRTAIYDITAQVVYLPNGERLEAHSGLGDMMDDPNSARHRNRGVTPPNTYELKLREELFHGVQAIRLNPVDENKMFGRDGMLAHTYMLGPNGQSNGCVSFSNYPEFLNAFLKGEVTRLAVVERLDSPPGRLAAGQLPEPVKDLLRATDRRPQYAAAGAH